MKKIIFVVLFLSTSLFAQVFTPFGCPYGVDNCTVTNYTDQYGNIIKVICWTDRFNGQTYCKEK